MQILYVDDDPAESKIVETMLYLSGHSCHTTNLGQQALGLAKGNHYDLIILDTMVPDIDGQNLIRQFRTAGVHTPVLAQTGPLDEKDARNGLGIGEDGYIVKPATQSVLVQCIEFIVSHSEPSCCHAAAS